MNKKNNLFADLNIKGHNDNNQGPLDISIEKIKGMVNEGIDSPYSERKRVIMKSGLKWISSAAAALILAGVLTLNIFPAAAQALSGVPVVGEIVKVVTFGRYQAKDNGYEANIATPKIEGLLDKELEEELNREFKDNAEALIIAYENDVKKLKKEFGNETVHMGIESDYTVKTDNDKILAIDVYIFNVAGSSSTKHTYYNIDKKANRLLSLKDLFKKNSDYITPISNYLKEQMKYENQHNNGLYWVEPDEFSESFERIDKNQKFYINDSGDLVICFDKYEVAAGAQGCPEFVIPRDAMGGIYKGI